VFTAIINYYIFNNTIVSIEKNMTRPSDLAMNPSSFRLTLNRKRRLWLTANSAYYRGSVVVEFALIFPLLLFIVFSIIECSLALYDKAVITNASREAARAGIILRTPKLTKTQIANVARDYCQNNLISFAQNVSPTVLVTDNGTNTFGTPLSVNVSYVYTGLGFGQLINALSGPITLSAITTMNNE
jgi:Flp pilus assembly protein TadG